MKLQETLDYHQLKEFDTLQRIYAQSAIACGITDAQGWLLYVNPAFTQLFEFSARRITPPVTRYNLLLDKKLQMAPDLPAILQRVYEQGESHCVDVSYPLRWSYKQPSAVTKFLSLRASFLPVKNNHNQVQCVLVQLQDVSRERMALQVLLKQQRELQQSEASYKAFIANSSEAIWCYDMVPPIPLSASPEEQVRLMAQSARLSQGNKTLVAMMGANSLQDLLGSGLHTSGSTRYVFDLQSFVSNQYQLVDYDIVREDRQSRRFYFQISCVGIIENNTVARVWGITKDVTVRKRYEQRLQHLSSHDALTGLPNRTYLYKEIQQFFDAENEQLAALLLIDLDRFKEINDTLGHQVGDRLLQLIGPRIAEQMMDVDGIIARLGGDEFAIFLPNVGCADNAISFAQRVLNALRLEFDLDVFSPEISASIGVSLAPAQAPNVSTLMRYADVAMYCAKQQISGVALYSAEIDPHSSKRLAMMSELGRAIREDQLCLYFQPKVNLQTQHCYGFEALLRWNHPNLGFVPPNEFIPIAELTSLIHPLTAWVLEKSIAQCCEWHAQQRPVCIAVNFSARNLLDDNMPKLVCALLEKYQLPASALEIEITESAIMSDPNRALRVLHQLHELGVQLSIDDFGTGYSSLAYLKKMPVQTLKIDLTFIRNMLNDKQDELIVESTIHLAHGLSLKVVAEGVENQPLVDHLKAMGCDEAQGYFIGRPMPLEQTNQWMNAAVWAITPPPK